MAKTTLYLAVLFVLLKLTYSQSLKIYDVDTKAFPRIKAKFFAIDKDYNQLLNLAKDDFEIFEDGMELEAISVSCSNPSIDKACIEFKNNGYNFIKIKIVSIYRREIETIVSKEHQIGKYSYCWMTNDIRPGVCFCYLMIGEDNYVEKVMVK